MFFKRDKSNNTYKDMSSERSSIASFSNSWMGNVGKSVAFSAYDTMRESSNAYRSMTDNIGIARNTKNRIVTDNKESIDETKKNIKNSLGEIIKNTKDSLVTGELHSKRRGDKAEEESMKSMGLDFGDMDDFSDLDGDFSDLDSDYSGEDYSDGEFFGPENDSNIVNDDSLDENPTLNIVKIKKVYNNNKTIKSGMSNSEINNIVSSVATSTLSLVNVQSSGFSKLSDGLSHISGNTVNSSNLFIEQLNVMKGHLEDIFQNSNKVSVGALKQNTSIEDAITGNFSIANFASTIEDNLGFIEMGAQGLNMKLAEIVANPISFLMTNAATRYIKKRDTNSFFGKINEKAGSLPLTMRSYLENNNLSESLKGVLDKDKVANILDNKHLSKVTNGRISTDSIKELLSKNNLSKTLIDKVFGGNLDGNLDLSSKVSKGTAVSFDAETHASINIVIPGYLSKILAIFTGTEIYNDYSSGRWEDKSFASKSLKNDESKYIYSESKRINNLSNSIFNSPENAKKLAYNLVTNEVYGINDLDNLEGLYPDDVIESIKDKIKEDPEEFSRSIREAEVIRSKFFKSNSVSGSKMNMFNGSDIEGHEIRDSSKATFNSKSEIEYNVFNSIDDTILDIKNILYTKFSSSSMAISDNIESITENTSPIEDTNIKDMAEEIRKDDSSKVVKNDDTSLDIPLEDKKSEIIDKLEVPEEVVEKSSTSTVTNEPTINNANMTESNEKESLSISDIKDKMDSFKDSKMYGKLKENKYVKKLTSKFSNSKASEIISNSQDDIMKHFGLPKSPKPEQSLKKMLDKTKYGDMMDTGIDMLGKFDDVKSMSSGSGVMKYADDAIAKLSSSKIGSNVIGKITSSKLGTTVMSKAGGKFAGKALGKLAGVASGPLGWALTLATSLPEIGKTLSNPIKSLMNPLSTIGAFLGLTEHPADDDTEQEKLNAGIGPDILKGSSLAVGGIGLGLAGMVYGLSKTLINISPLGMLTHMGKRASSMILNNEAMTQSIVSPKKFAERLFALTPIGGLYSIAKGGLNVAGSIGSMLKGLFDSIGGNNSSGTASASTQTASATSNPSSETSSGNVGTISSSSFGSGYTKTSDFGYRAFVGAGTTDHKGTDYGANEGTPIKAVGAGTVTVSTFQSSRGNYIKIKNGNIEYLYQHNKVNYVSVGDYVNVGDVIGEVGSTGDSTGPHLHFELIANGVQVNPETGLDINGNNILNSLGEGQSVASPISNFNSQATIANSSPSSTVSNSSTVTSSTPSAYTILTDSQKNSITSRISSKYNSSFGNVNGNSSQIIPAVPSVDSYGNVTPPKPTTVNNSSNSSNSSNTSNSSSSSSNTSNSSSSSSASSSIKNIVNTIVNTTNKIINNIIKVPSSEAEGNVQYSYDYDQYLVLRDILDIVENIGENTLGMSNEMDNILDAINLTNEGLLENNSKRLSMTEILQNLNNSISINNVT